MWVIRAILITVLLILVIGFAYNNTGPDQVVDVHLQPLLPNYLDVPLLTVVFWAFVAGSLLSLLLFVTTYLKLSVQLRSQRRRIRALEAEVAILRNRPIEESAGLLKGLDEQRQAVESPFDRVSEDG